MEYTIAYQLLNLGAGSKGPGQTDVRTFHERGVPGLVQGKQVAHLMIQSLVGERVRCELVS